MENQKNNMKLPFKNPKVSVIVPVYNVAQYLRECLDSILSQTLYEIEVICGDGGSTDGSIEILKEYAKRDNRVIVFTAPGSGYGQSVNYCIRIARGKYIGIVESDDVIKEDMYEILYRKAEEFTLDWIRGDIYFLTSRRGQAHTHYEKIIIGNFYNKVLNPQIDPRPYRSRLRTWSGIYNKSFLEKYNITHNETPGASFQDVGFYLKTLYYAQKVMFIHRGLYCWRRDNPNSSVNDNSNMIIEKSNTEWKLEREYIESNRIYNRQIICAFRYRQFLAYIWMIDLTQGASKETARHELLAEMKKAKKLSEIDIRFFTVREWIEFKRFVSTGKTLHEQHYRLFQVKRIIEKTFFPKEV